MEWLLNILMSKNNADLLDWVEALFYLNKPVSKYLVIERKQVSGTLSPLIYWLLKACTSSLIVILKIKSIKHEGNGIISHRF